MNSITFKPVGLPAGTNYIVSIASVTKSAIAPDTVTMEIPSGKYTYSYSAIPCGYPNQVKQTSITSNETIPLQFVKSVSTCNCQKVTTSTSVPPTFPPPKTMADYISYSLAAVFLGAAGVISYKFYKLKH